MSKKSILKGENPVNAYLTSAKVEEQAPKQAHTEATQGAGIIQSLEKKEYRSRRMQILVKPSTAENLHKISEDTGRSTNDIVNLILEEYTKDI